jgi:poly(3-hydroxybutyrate) depolymerase
MRNGRQLLGAVLVMTALLAACSGGGGTPEPEDRMIRPGLGDFTFRGYAPLADRPVRIWYDAPADPSTAQILIVMHGQGRNAEGYRSDWHEQVASNNVLVLVPEFSDEYYPGTEGYNLGNMVDGDGDLQPEEEWSFHLVEALFDFVVRETGGRAVDFALFGHSAGAQFVHRFVEFMPAHRARIAVAANAGWYTTLDDSVPFPYGLDGAPSQQSVPKRAFASNLVILLGADDIETESDSLRRDSDSDVQGSNRLDRGMNFYRGSRTVAARDSLGFRWQLMVVPGIAHSHHDIAPLAAPLLIGDAR